MRYINIDLSSDNHLQQLKIFGGYAGEHNETVLQVTLPQRMIGIEYSDYRFDFQTSEDNEIPVPVSKPINGVLSCHLTEQLTVAGKLLFNVVARKLDGKVVSLTSKTNMVNLYIGDSPDGNSVLPDPTGYKDELLEMIDERIDQLGSGKSAYEIALQEGFEGTEEEWLESLQGTSGVYVGSGDMPEDCNVQIDPDGEVFTIDQTYNPESSNAQSGIAVAEGIAQLDLKGYEVIDDITISEGVRSVVFSNSSQKDYTEFFLICSMGVATDGKLQCAIKMNGGNTYLAWKQLNASAKTTENYLWWHYAKYIGKTGVQNNKNQYAWISQFPDTSITTQDGGIITQGISSNNKSQYCDISNGPVGNKSENYEISSVGSSSAFVSGSRFILLGRGTRQ